MKSLHMRNLAATILELMIIVTCSSVINLLVSATSAHNYNFSIAKPNCIDRCGDVRIPYPFGLNTSQDCYESQHFFTTCNYTYNPPKLFLQDSNLEITDISLEGQLTLLQFIAKDCYDNNKSRVSYNGPSIWLTGSILVNYTANKFTLVGCDTYGYAFGNMLNYRMYATGCMSKCYAKGDLIEGSCTGLGCCQTSIPKDVWKVNLSLGSYDNYSSVRDYNECGYAFVVKEGVFNFSVSNFTSLRSVEKLPLVADWAVGNVTTCDEAQANASSYACKSEHSECYKPDNGYGYRCSCLNGFKGNPYLTDGCKDIDECRANNHNCEKDEYCLNALGNFTCKCPKGYHGDGIKGGGGCYRGESLVLKLVAGISLGIVVLMLAASWLHLELKRRRLLRMRKRFFLQNGGARLQEKLTRRDGSSHSTASIFSEAELQKATNHFHSSMIIGQGGFGTVYKGLLPDNRVVAIKKSKQVDPNVVDPKQVEQFVNEVVILSQINHRNVVKFLGCCVETPVPLLVFEFVTNGTLFEHIHDKAKSRFLTWDLRLRIATEAAGVLSYLHSSASTPIIHRDVKSANILLDHTFTAKVSDFGASRLVPLDQTQMTTMVQGTWGYLDPEYMQTSQLTEKSDVYSFGVVLVELLTGMKALSYERPENEQNLANFFLAAMKQDGLVHILDDSVVATEGDIEHRLMRVALLARSCLCVRGEDRPDMKEVTTELEGLITREGKHSWDRNVEETESLLGFSGFIGGVAGNSVSSAAFDSVRSSAALERGR